MNRLPAKYRLPIVLCDLEGYTHQEAARFLGWPIGTIKSRQAQGRALLRERLTRRGLGLAVTGAVIESLRQSAIAAIPNDSRRITVNAAMHQAGRLLTGFVVSTSVLTLTQGVLRAMLWIRIRFLAIAILAIGIASSGAIISVCAALKTQRRGTTSKPRRRPRNRRVRNPSRPTMCRSGSRSTRPSRRPKPLKIPRPDEPP